MAERFNDSTEPVEVSWCTVPEHYSSDGQHDSAASGHRVKTHTLQSGVVLIYDDTALNAPTIEAEVARLAPIEQGA